MVDRPQRPDVVVVGAGAAGIAAGRELLRLGRSVLLVEARDRVGGRAWTVPSGFDAPFDLGCEWLHSADANLLTPMAAEQGFAIDKSEPPWRRPSYQARFDGDGQEAFWAAQSLFEERVEAAAAEAARGGFDRPAASLLESGGRWNGMLGAISTYYNGAPLERVSVVDYSRYRDTEINWRVVGGYGALIEKLGADLPVRFGCAVTRVDATGRELRVVTSAGTLRTDAVIVTVPTDVLASGAITFSPAFDRHMAAAAVLPLGIADKLYLRLRGAEEFEPDTRLGGPSDRGATGAYTLRPGGRPVVEGYFGGDYARQLEKGGLSAFVAAAEEEIGAVLGRDFCRRLTPIRATAWARDPFSLGSYSHALPGHAEARAVLATPTEDRIFFAGEAVSPHFFSTAHGAFETGLAAARAVRPRA